MNTLYYLLKVTSLRYVNKNSIIDDVQDLKNVELPFHK